MVDRLLGGRSQLLADSGGCVFQDSRRIGLGPVVTRRGDQADDPQGRGPDGIVGRDRDASLPRRLVVVGNGLAVHADQDVPPLVSRGARPAVTVHQGGGRLGVLDHDLAGGKIRRADGRGGGLGLLGLGCHVINPFSWLLHHCNVTVTMVPHGKRHGNGIMAKILTIVPVTAHVSRSVGGR